MEQTCVGHTWKHLNLLIRYEDEHQDSVCFRLRLRKGTQSYIQSLNRLVADYIVLSGGYECTDKYFCSRGAWDEVGHIEVKSGRCVVWRRTWAWITIVSKGSGQWSCDITTNSMLRESVRGRRGWGSIADPGWFLGVWLNWELCNYHSSSRIVGLTILACPVRGGCHMTGDELKWVGEDPQDFMLPTQSFSSRWCENSEEYIIRRITCLSVS